MKAFHRLLPSMLAVTLCAGLATAAPRTGWPRAFIPDLMHGSSARGLGKTAGTVNGHDWSLLSHTRPSGRTDTLHIIAIRMEFNKGIGDTSELTTGNGLFGINAGSGPGTRADAQEKSWYNQDSIYRYDALPHYRTYFDAQLQFAQTYFHRVSRGKLAVTYDIFPGPSEAAYAVDSTMATYSPAAKKPDESYDDYYYRKTRGLMKFVQQAIKAADAEKGSLGARYPSPFAGISYGPDSALVDSNGNRVGILLIHAGASYLTDGGEQGSFGANSPSDMIDAFVYGDFFRYFKDTLKLDTAGRRVGIRVKGAGGGDLMVEEVMMMPEMSNQDKLNWGVHGILVNQIARQLGIPDLFSTSSGISGIGAFCIMDFAGYSASQGFVPPWPSAWVRAFMGWDQPHVATIGAVSQCNVKALCAADSTGSDTTILLVPINDHEYFLVENRQRNLTGRRNIFNYDTADDNAKTQYIRSYPYNVRLDSCGLTVDSSRVIVDADNYDVGIPASGIVVWHIDENVIRSRLAGNMVNADSLYRGVSLVEADGITDLGIMFRDIFYQAAFDWGGAEDVFPHITRKPDGTTFSVNGFGPRTRPSTKSNDGGQTYLSVSISRNGTRTEISQTMRGDFITNSVDTFFAVDVNWDFLSPGWPKRMAPDSFFDPLVWKPQAGPAKRFTAVLGKSGRLYAYQADTSSFGSLGAMTTVFARKDMRGDTARDSAGNPDMDTVTILDSIGGPVSFPSEIGGRVFVPAANSDSGMIRVLEGFTPAGGPSWLPEIPLSSRPSTYVCGYGGGKWAIGCTDGRLYLGRDADTVRSTLLAGDAPVCALAAFGQGSDGVVAIQTDGRLSLCHDTSSGPYANVMVKNGIPPYTLVTGNLDNDTMNGPEIVVCDSRHGLWAYNRDLTLATGWDAEPNDWASILHTGDVRTPAERVKLPVNNASPALTDINGDGCLDILVGGNGGLFAFNYKGVLVNSWPYYLDNRFWYQRGVVASTPVAGTGPDGKPLVLFASPSGDNATFAISRIDSTNRDRTTVYYRREDGTTDSIWELRTSMVDSILKFNDSIIAPYVLPGGYLDAVTAAARRPQASVITTSTVGSDPFYYWPVTMGAPTACSPVWSDIDSNGRADLIALSRTGWIYRWEVGDSVCKAGPVFWGQAGSDNGRSFRYGQPPPAAITANLEPVRLYNYPNPTHGSPVTVFRYAFSAKARNVRLDIYTYTGYRMYTWQEPANQAAHNYPDWNETPLDLKGFGPGVYKCRMEATINGKKYSKIWKMAVIK